MAEVGEKGASLRKAAGLIVILGISKEKYQITVFTRRIPEVIECN